MHRPVVLILLILVAGVAAGVQTPASTQAGPTGKMFWSDDGTNSIRRANLDGSGVEDLLAGNIPEGIALDIIGGKMYWTDDSVSPKIQRANLDGSSEETLVQIGLLNPAGMALDVAGGKMYWTDTGTQKIQRANLNGSGIEDLVTAADGIDFPGGITLDTANGKMYWTDGGYEKIQRANLDGTSIEDLVTITAGLESPEGITLDIAGGKMYWTDPGNAKIARANLDGSAVEYLVTTGLLFPKGIDLDLVNGKMYWGDDGTNKIQRANLDGSAVEDLIQGASLFPEDIALCPVDGDGIADNVDTIPCVSSVGFSDQPLGGTTSGTIVILFGLATVTITEEPNPTGVLIAAGGPSGYAQISACTTPVLNVTMNPGESAIVTCASATADVLAGPITAEFASIGVEVPTGVKMTVSEAGPGSYQVTNARTSATSITVDGVVLAPGESTVVTPPAVGGISALPDLHAFPRVDGPLEASGSPGPGVGVLAGIAAAVAGAVALGFGAFRLAALRS